MDPFRCARWRGKCPRGRQVAWEPVPLAYVYIIPQDEPALNRQARKPNDFKGLQARFLKLLDFFEARKNPNDSAYLEHLHLGKGSQTQTLHLHIPTCRQTFFSFFFIFFKIHTPPHVCLHPPTLTYTYPHVGIRKIKYTKISIYLHVGKGNLLEYSVVQCGQRWTRVYKGIQMQVKVI